MQGKLGEWMKKWREMRKGLGGGMNVWLKKTRNNEERIRKSNRIIIRNENNDDVDHNLLAVPAGGARN